MDGNSGYKLEEEEEDELEQDPLNGFWMEGDSLAPPCQADMDVVDAILALANPTKEDCLFDLGCGDGRICLRASQLYGCKSVGCEIEEKLINKGKINIERMKLDDKVTIIHGDLQDIDLSIATIVILYLLPDAVVKITPMLIDAIQHGAKVICNTWGPKVLQPSKRIQCGFCNNVTLLMYDQSSLASINSEHNNNNDNDNDNNN